MRVVLDTNILCSALLTPGGPTDRLYRAWRDKRFELITSEEQLDELRRITRYPRVRAYIEPAAAGSMLNELRRLATFVTKLPAVDQSRDPGRQDDLERRIATLTLRRDARTVAIDGRIVERSYQRDCIDALTVEIQRGRRKLLVEMATGTGKTRTAAALIKRLFEANAVTRVLFIVDRITLANQTEDAFAEHLADFPSYVLRSGRRFQDEKRITITTLQSMVNIYRDYSAGYFDLVISDECHRSIYGKWRGVLEHFDGIQIGLTATPCVATLDDDAPDEEDKAFVRDTLRFFEVDRPTYSYKLKDAIREGYLVPYQIYKARAVNTAAEGGFPIARADLDWTAMDAGMRTDFEELFAKEGDSITVDPSALERRFTIPERNRARTTRQH
jgi:type I restriction enzyme R subunit